MSDCHLGLILAAYLMARWTTAWLNAVIDGIQLLREGPR